MSLAANEDAILIQQRGSTGSLITYRTTDRNAIRPVNNFRNVASSFWQEIYNFFREVLLPYGYPNSVSADYFNYQLWDTLQAFCSTITGIFTTQAVLKGVGVGNAQATALSATMTWILKDGTGMIGRIVFAWWKGNSLDSNCKKWRLFADILNDAAMVLELCIPYTAGVSTELLCLSTTMKSVVGVAGGATRASITNHQAIKDNMAEVSAKDGSQETLVNLIASFTGIFLINYFTSAISQWSVITCLILLHLYSNYRAVQSLVFSNFNAPRLGLVLRHYFIVNAVLTPEKINRIEPVVIGFGRETERFCQFKICLGRSLGKTLKQYNSDEVKNIVAVYKDRNYFLLPDLKRRRIFVSFGKSESAEDILGGYYHAVLLALAIGIYNNQTLDFYAKRQLHHSTAVTRLCSLIKSQVNRSEVENGGELRNLPHQTLIVLNEFIEREMEMFFSALQINGWNTANHSMPIDEWKTEWKEPNKKTL